MGIVTDNDLDVTVGDIVEPDHRVFRSSEELKTSTIFDKDTHVSTLVNYIKGMKWDITYFLQILNLNDTTNPPDINIPVSVQKYNRINHLIIYLQNPISQSDPENITGEAVINSGFVPRLNDAIIATLTGGREAVFIVTNIVNNTYNQKQIYTIEFKLFKFIDENPAVYNDLLVKVMKEYVYDKEHMLDYSAPVILAADYKKKVNLKYKLPELADYYLANFVNSQYKILALATETSVYVDTLLNSFIFKILEHTDDNDMLYINRVSYDLSGSVKYTIWDALLNRNLGILSRATKTLGFKYIPAAVDNPVNRHISYMGIQFVISKLDNIEDAEIPDYIDLATHRDATYIEPVPVDITTYVLSDSFYTNNKLTCTGFETLVLMYLNGEVLDSSLLDIYLTQYTQWDTKQQYYLIPILIVLLKDVISNTYTSL